MGLRNFDYLEPSSVQEACQVLSEDPEEARIYAGGTSLLLLMKQGSSDRPTWSTSRNCRTFAISKRMRVPFASDL